MVKPRPWRYLALIEEEGTHAEKGETLSLAGL
jgi:hypothetical protein